MRAALAVLLLVALPVLGGPNARDAPLSTGAAIQDLAVASGSGSLLAGTLDPGDKIMDRDAAVWYLWERAGAQVWALPADRADCATRLQDDCKSPVLGVALSSDGRKAVIMTAVDASTLQGDGNRTLLTLVTSNQGIVLRQSLAHDGVAVRLSRDGALFAVLATDGSAASDDAHVYAFNWPATGATTLGTPRIDEALPGTATSIALSPDGQELAVGGARYWHYAGTTGNAKTTTATTTAVGAVAVNADHQTVVGHSNGVVSLYGPSGNDKAATFGRQPGTNAVTSVAFAGSLYAAGDSAGRLHVYRVTPTGPDPAQAVLTHTVGTGSIMDLSISDDGRYFVLRQGRTVHFLTFDGTALASGWTDTLPADPVALAMDAKADLIAAAHGTSVRVYDALHQITVSGPGSLTVAPGATRDVDVTVRNTGNRAESVTLQPGAYAGWTLGLDQTSLTLAAGAQATVKATVTVPDHWPAGPSGFFVNHTLATGPTGSARLLVDVPPLSQLTLAALGNAYTRGIEPGGSTAYQLELANAGNTEVTTDILASKPGTGWTVTADPAQATLAPGQTVQVDITLTAPAGLADGETVSFPVRLSASAAEVTLYATAGAVFGVRVDGPDGILIGRGNTTVFDVTVKNEGNAPDSFNLGVEPFPLGWSLTFSDGLETASLLDVAAGATVTVPVVLFVPASAEVGHHQLIGVRATSGADAAKRDVADIFVTVTEAGEATCGKGKEFKDGRCQDTPLPLVVLLVALLVAARRRR